MTDLVSRLRKEGERCDAEACFTAADEITRLRAELAEAAWRPISTAPDSGWVLIARAHATLPVIAKYDSTYGAFEDALGDHVYHATHWRPLPKMPTAENDAAMAGGEHG